MISIKSFVAKQLLYDVVLQIHGKELDCWNISIRRNLPNLCWIILFNACAGLYISSLFDEQMKRPIQYWWFNF